jgi:3-hydroxybutyryl-CoA dehydrogenase
VSVARVGVAGAGTMGSGIAQLAVLGGYETFLHDPDGAALAAGAERLREGLRKGMERGRWSEADAIAAVKRLIPATRLDDLGGCDLIVEAAPEDLEIKREVFARLATACEPETILATNTSSLSVTAIAAAVEHPRRVVGMHFFNPPPLMRLVEIVAGEESGTDPLEEATEVARRMQRTPIRARDEIGFIANRCVRPFTLEALRILGDRTATHDQIDRIMRVGGGFRMGPFEMMDLVGVDVGFEVAKSFWEQSFHEPRWQPHPIQAKMVASGRFGRKSGRGYYEYGAGPHRPDDPESAGSDADVTAWAGDDDIDLDADVQRWILGRIVCQLVNEAAFTLQGEIGSAEDIDTAMRLGFNWPRGPLEWGDAIGPARIVGMLDALHSELGEGRYRTAPLLRRVAEQGGALR